MTTTDEHETGWPKNRTGSETGTTGTNLPGRETGSVGTVFRNRNRASLSRCAKAQLESSRGRGVTERGGTVLRSSQHFSALA